MSKIMKELRDLGADELPKRLDDLNKEKFKLNAARASGAAQQDVSKFRLVRRNIARVKTLIREQEIVKKKSESKKSSGKKKVKKGMESSN